MNKKQQNQPKKVLQIARYKSAFLRPTGVVARCGKSVYICPDFHKKLSRIVCILGEGDITLTDYLCHFALEYHHLFALECHH